MDGVVVTLVMDSETYAVVTRFRSTFSLKEKLKSIHSDLYLIIYFFIIMIECVLEGYLGLKTT